MAVQITDNGKTQRPSVCNALETCLVHEAVAEQFLPMLQQKLEEHQVEIRGCERTRQILGDSVIPATEEDYATDFGLYYLHPRCNVLWMRQYNIFPNILQVIRSVLSRKAIVMRKNSKRKWILHVYMSIARQDLPMVENLVWVQKLESRRRNCMREDQWDCGK